MDVRHGIWYRCYISDLCDIYRNSIHQHMLCTTAKSPIKPQKWFLSHLQSPFNGDNYGCCCCWEIYWLFMLSVRYLKSSCRSINFRHYSSVELKKEMTPSRSGKVKFKSISKYSKSIENSNFQIKLPEFFFTLLTKYNSNHFVYLFFFSYLYF